MQLKVFVLLLTIIYVVSCESHMNTEVENEAQMEQRSQEINNLYEEIINEESIMTSGRTSDGSQTANEGTQNFLAINPNPKPTSQVVEANQNKTAYQKPSHNEHETHHRAQPVNEINVAQPPQKVNVTYQKPQPVQVIVTQPTPNPIPETHVSTHPPRCVFINSEGTCATIPNFFSCIRDGGILAPDIVRCSWIQACCIRNFLG